MAFVAYFPEESFFERLDVALAANVKCWLFDNTPGGDQRLKARSTIPGFTYLHQANTNIGLGPAMHQLLFEAWHSGIKSILYFDQDTVFTPQSLLFINGWSSTLTNPSLAAIHFQSSKLISTGELVQAKLFFNTACLFDLEKLRQIGWHDSSFFVEGVDYKFCLDAATAGFFLGIVGGAPGIDHERLQPNQRLSLFGKERLVRLYPAWRMRGFSWAMVRLTALSLKRKRLDYAYIFSRNLATFWVTQLLYRLLKLIFYPMQPTTRSFEAGLLTYSASGKLGNVWSKFSSGFSRETFVVNNAITHPEFGELCGDNTHFEFSGYRVVAANFGGNGPYLIVNDTLFKNHQTYLWRRLVRNALAKVDLNDKAIWGDIRRDGSSLAERPSPFLASWIFVIPNRRVLSIFIQTLETLIKEPLPPFSGDYERYLDLWLSKRLFGGWHGVRSEQALARKRMAIKYEHTLSLRLLLAGIELRSIGENQPAWYFVTRVADRIFTRMLSIRKPKLPQHLLSTINYL